MSSQVCKKAKGWFIVGVESRGAMDSTCSTTHQSDQGTVIWVWLMCYLAQFYGSYSVWLHETGTVSSACLEACTNGCSVGSRFPSWMQENRAP